VVNILRYSQVMQDNETLREAIEGNPEDILCECPWDPAGWAFMPLLDTAAVGTNYLCVIDPSGCVRCNACCAWTVPAGATQAQFQMWGAGATGGAAQCCGGAPFGQNGAYATTIINVTPGDSYTLCAGCSYCCNAQPGESGETQGGVTYVQGPGLCNVCAEGGCSSLHCHMGAMIGTYSCCRFHGVNDTSTAAGGCICAGGRWFCHSNSCGSCGILEYVCGKTKYYGCTTAAVGSAPVYGIPGVHSSGCWDNSFYGYWHAAPVVDIDHTKRPGSDCCMTWTSGDCCGGCKCSASNGIFCWPGQGHFGVQVNSENYCYYGDMGRGGMVRVSWC
jgi:hypothetical protein